MTTIYFIRHAESDSSVRDGRIRPLTEKGLADRALVTEYLKDKKIDAVLSSPFKRAVDTVADFADKYGFEIELIEDFREHKISDAWVDDYESLCKKHWIDFKLKLPDCESLSEAQNRNITALKEVLARHKNKNIVIGTHGMALSTIINFYDNAYGFDDFMSMAYITPWVVKMDFNEDGCVGMDKIDLFQPDQKPDYERAVVVTPVLGALKAYRFVVTFARHNDKWLYCRAKERDTYENPGGHIEPGETPLDAAKRELYEETGATGFDITPAFDYNVHIPTGYSNGQIFFALVNKLGPMPDYEMAEVKLFDAIPDKMRFPTILPVLYGKMQGWLNLQSAKDEMWDVYDSERKLTGEKHRRADPLPAGAYHLVVHVWLLDDKGEFLITKRSPNKGYPNMWECTGGSAVAGDDSITAALREVREETGLTADPAKAERVMTIKRDDSFCDVWLFRQDFNIESVVLQENETVGAKCAPEDEIRKMTAAGEFVVFDYFDELMTITAYRQISDIPAAAASHDIL